MTRRDERLEPRLQGPQSPQHLLSRSLQTDKEKFVNLCLDAVPTLGRSRAGTSVEDTLQGEARPPRVRIRLAGLRRLATGTPQGLPPAHLPLPELNSLHNPLFFQLGKCGVRASEPSSASWDVPRWGQTALGAWNFSLMEN